MTALVYTYSTHPAAVFSPERIPPLLETPEEKVRSLALTGADAAVLRPFTRDYAVLSPKDFLCMLERTLHPRHIVVGYNYTFGARGSGRAEDLIRLGRTCGFQTHIVEEISLNGRPVSSTRIRGNLTDGDAEEALRCLGRAYMLSGEVTPGRRIGTRIGFPTANLPYPPGKVIPKGGVYAGCASVCGTLYPAAINFGCQPTVEGTPRIEAHLLEYTGGDLYGRRMRVALIQRLRDERRFVSLEALGQQLAADCDSVRKAVSLNRYSCF